MGRGISIRSITPKCRGNIHNRFRGDHKAAEVKPRMLELKQKTAEARAARLQASNMQGGKFNAIA